MNTDRITSDRSVMGVVSDESRIASFRVGLDAAAPATFVEAVTALQMDGSFHFNRSQLQQLLGTTLLDGPHALRFQATDIAGNVSDVVTIEFVIDTVATTPAVDLSVGSDSGLVGDHTTSAARVTLVGQTEANAVVSLMGTGVTSLASAAGVFQIPDVLLAFGNNSLSVQAVDVAGNSAASNVVIHRENTPAQTDPVLRWNSAALEAARRDGSSPPVATRNLAMVSLAMFDVVCAIEGTPGYYVNLTPPPGISLAAAVSGAAYRVLEYAYPSQSAALDAVLADVLSAVPNDPGETGGLAFGRQVASD